MTCPMDHPREAANDHWDLVAPLTVSSLYLTANQTYRGHCQLIFDPRHATSPSQLSPEEWTAYAADLYDAQRAIVSVVKPDHLNVELLGNVVPHLHWHIVPRYTTDARWGQVIWTTPLSAMPDTRLEPAARQALLASLRAALNPRS